MKIISGAKTSEDVNRVKKKNVIKAARENPTGMTSMISHENPASFVVIHPFEKGKCPAWGHRCRQCGGRNHFASKCKKPGKRVHKISSTDTPASSMDDNEDIDYITSIAVESANICSVEPSDNSNLPKEIYTEMLIDDKSIKFQIDCGSSINILPKDVVDNYDLAPTTKTLIMWDKTEVTPLGTARIIVTNPRNRKKYSVEFVVVAGRLTPLIGARAAQHMKLLTIHWSNFKSVPVPNRNEGVIHQLLTVQQVVTQYPRVFKSQLGRFPGMVKVEVDPSVQPTITPTRRIPTALKERFKKEIDRLQSLGVIAPVDRPTPWVSSVVVATKKSGALRICIEPRPLNAALKRERYQLPILDDVLPELGRAQVFSTVDLRSGYWHCVLDEESSILTTFATPFGRYRWCRLPFGLSVSSEIFQKRVNQALAGLEGVLDIVDDILIYGVGDTEEQANADHDQKLTRLLERCQSQGIALNPDKLKLRTKSVTFMGHVLTNEGIRIDPDKAKAIREMPKPNDIEGVQRLNGFVNYLAKFLPRLADSMEPIRRLTRKNEPWNWTKEQDKAFEEVQKMVTEAPILSYYNPSSPLAIQCDASQKGLGAALLQNGKPVAYASRALSDAETRYAQIEKEMLAIVYALEKFNQFTFGRHVTVYSDHKPLEAILK